MDWNRRGYEDYGNGVPRAASPQPAGTAIGDAWLAGWDEAQGICERQEESNTYEVAPVSVRLDGNKLRLVDHVGRVLGEQSYVAVETAEESFNVTVTFRSVDILTD